MTIGSARSSREEHLGAAIRPCSARALVLVLLLALNGLAAGAVGAEEPPADGVPQDVPTSVPEPGPASVPEDLEIEFERATQLPNGDSVLVGNVTMTWRGSRVQADRITLTGQRYFEAEGNVLVVWQGNRIYGTRMTYDLELERGTIEEAYGQVENDYLFWARTAEKVGDDRVHLVDATVTTCTQPVPYWSFSVTSASIRIDGYAHMYNVRLRARRLPIIYMPYILWPVKKNRAAGLLMPEFHTTQDRGRAITQDLFIPLGRSADVTLRGRYYTEAGFGGGGELRFIPNSRGQATLNGFYINDEVAGAGRYRASYQQQQQFSNGFRMVADINLVSDFDYFTDFERELNLVSSPTILARLEFSRNGKWTSVNVRELRREQLFSDGGSLVQQTLPEIELRGRSRRLGSSPVYLSYESSLSSIQQRRDETGLDLDYMRADLSPTLTMPLSPWPWLEVTPRVSYRATHYTDSERTIDDGAGGTQDVVVGDSLTRTVWNAGLEIAGPKMFRIYERPDNPFSTRYKHTIEPRIVYRRGQDVDNEGILVFDEVDRISSTGNEVNYSLVQRLFAQRPRSEPTPDLAGEQPIVLPDGTTGAEPGEESEVDPAKGDTVDTRPREPVEIASFELRQRHSFEEDISLADFDGDGTSEESSRFSSVQVVGRYNPNQQTSFDLRGDYDILYRRFSGITASGSLRARLAQVRFSLVHRNGLGIGATDDTQVQLASGLSLFRNRLRIDLRGSFDADPAPGQPHVPDKRWRVQYRNQCCTFIVERLARNFSGATDRQDFYFRVDLSGIGKLLDFKY